MDKYLSVICKKSFTFHNGKRVEVGEFTPLFKEGEVYQAVLEPNKCGSHLWVRNDPTSEKYGPGARFTNESSGGLAYPLYTDYFYSLVQSRRILKLEKLNI